ncbi:hypothetical protein AUR64_17895 [Haloprofundus marisrubri]|uniref:DUF2238 domain-containing protein n=1 Tax=Haloprofundus marisrubri TaxID=1514971 RepID=A0A0W1R539_9EURY|nr:hypothetical protein [Haloprofundus marisrubri]KTG08549.1 hypothetical protein AUR64_17895 [Haloprofundus marisrubri]
MRVREQLGIGERRQAQIARAMQVFLIGMVAIGVERGDWGVVVNAGVALGVTYLPALLERDYHIPMDAGLTLWVTTAVFLHAIGSGGLPGVETGLYRQFWWWDHMTHTLSASIVAAVGYTAARAFDVHTDAVQLPPRFMFVFILMFTVAFGVFWEVLEFAIGEVAAMSGGEPVLTQFGLSDTLVDIMFNTLGGVVVAVWGTAHLSDVVGAVAERFGRGQVESD